MRDLEQTLLQIGRELEWPETPDLASSVLATLRAAPAGEAEQPTPSEAERPAPGAEPPAPGAERRLRVPEADEVDGRRAGGRRLGLRLAERRLGIRGLLPPRGLRRALVLALVSL